MTQPGFSPPPSFRPSCRPSFPSPKRSYRRLQLQCTHRLTDKTILVTGATGPTGLKIIHSLHVRGAKVRALIRPKTYLRLRPRVHAIQQVCPTVRFVMADLRDPSTLPRAVAGCDGIICASGTRNFEATDSNRPEIVDFRGVQRLIDAFWDVQLERDLTMMLLDDVEGEEGGEVRDGVVPVAEAGGAVAASSFVLVSSLGVTRPERFPQLQQMGNILTWKMCGEDALRKSGLPFTIVRPGGLTDAQGGERGVVVDQGDRLAGSIPREDVAEICAEALFSKQATNVTFECVGRLGGGGKVTESIFDGLKADVIEWA